MTTTSNRATVVKLRKEQPNMTLQEMGGQIGISRERVRQILVSENLSTRSIKEVERRTFKPLPRCESCNLPTKAYNRKYCSNNCRFPNGWTTFACYRCGKEITIETSQYKKRVKHYNHIHCSKSCSTKTYWETKVNNGEQQT